MLYVFNMYLLIKIKQQALSFHLTTAEKTEIASALNNELNMEELNKLKNNFQHSD
jgi:hypothetical protein